MSGTSTSNMSQPVPSSTSSTQPSPSTAGAQSAQPAVAEATPNTASNQLAERPYTGERVLSMQSSVVYGYVGNKASNFPLQLLGFDVDPLHSCQFSNHTGHPTFSGYKTSDDDVIRITQGLYDNGFIKKYSHVLTGYMSNVPFLNECVTLIYEMKKNRPDLLFACDPVLGDNNEYYVPAIFVDIYRRSLIPIADIVFPNQTEAEGLSSIKITDVESAYANLVWFHQQGVRIVIITSMTFKESPNTIQIMASIASKANPYPTKILTMQFEKVPLYFSGTGDMTAALALAWLVRSKEEEDLKAGNPAPTVKPTAASVAAAGGAAAGFTFDQLKHSLEKTMATLQAIIHRTYAVKSEELLLVQSKRDIENPRITQTAFEVDATAFADNSKAKHASNAPVSAK